MLKQSIRTAPELWNEVPSPRNLDECLDLANRLYREFHGQCFWHCRPDLVITEDRIPFVVKGLRGNGGHRGFVLAGKLLAKPPGLPSATPKGLECH